MVKPLSAQLADLSVRAKSAEDAVAAAQKEAHDKVVARTERMLLLLRRSRRWIGTSSPPTMTSPPTGMR